MLALVRGESETASAATRQRVVIAGATRIGLDLARRLEAEDLHVVVIEENSARAREAAEILGNVLVVQGRPTDETLLEDQVEVIEAECAVDSPLTGRAIAELDLPPGALVAALRREQRIVVPRAVALGYGESPWAWVGSCVGLVGPSALIAFLARPTARTLRPRDAYLIVAAGWLLASVAGAVPYVIHGTHGPVDAFFESAAGFTTTGSTVMRKIEGTAAALLFWRSLTQ